MNPETLAGQVAADERVPMPENVPDGDLPLSLAAVVLEAKSAPDFELHGFVRMPRKIHRYLHRGTEVRPDFAAWGVDGFRRDAIPLLDGRKLPAADVKIRVDQPAWWFAILSGDTRAAESWFWKRGFERAFADSSTHCAVMPVE